MTYRTLSRCGSLLVLFSLGLVRSETSRPIEAYNRLPLRFEPNRGQRPSSVDFVSRGPDRELLLSAGEAALALGSGQSAPVRLKWTGAAHAKRATGVKELPGRSNYLVGNDPDKWLTDIPNYAQVRYDGLYPGIDLTFYGRQGELEFDYIVSPGVDPATIRIRVEGASLRLNAEGDLVLSAGGEEVRLKRPYAYQESRGQRSKVEARYALKSGNEIGFHVGPHDRTRTLVIDPVLSFSKVLGGQGDDFATGVAVDPAGNVYLTGSTRSSDFPVQNPLQPLRTALCTAGPPRTTINCSDAFVAKLDPTGTTLLYSTYLGGRNDDGGTAIAADESGNAYVTGWATSSDFPITTVGQSASEDWSPFVAKLGPTGNLLFSTRLRAETATAIAADRAGNAYVTGYTGSTDFPTVQPFQGALASAWLLKSYDSGTTWGPVRTDGVLANQLTIDPQQPLTMYAWNPVEVSVKVWKTEDGGPTWRLVLSTEILQALGVLADHCYGVSMDPVSPSTLYAALGSAGVVKSLDGGDSWRTINDGLPLPSSSVNSIFVDPARQATLYAATGTGVFKSTDAGAHWQSTPPVPGDGSGSSQSISLLLTDPLHPSAIYAAGYGGVFRLSEGGASWTALNNGFGRPDPGINKLVVDTRDPLTLYAAGSAFWKSSDGGASWTSLVLPENAPVCSLATDPRTSALYVGTNHERVLASADGGATWSQADLRSGLDYGHIVSLIIDPITPSTLYAATDATREDAFLAKFGPTGALVYSTYLGGTGADYGYAVAVDSAGSAYVAGSTDSSDFPGAGASHGDQAGNSYRGAEVFVVKFNPAGSALVYSTVFGGSQDDVARAIALDSSGGAYVTGMTKSSDFPTLGAVQPTPGGGEDAFVAKLNPENGAPVYSTYLGGSRDDEGRAIGVDALGSAHVAGYTESLDFPVKNTSDSSFGSYTIAAFLTRLNPSGSVLAYSTYLGYSFYIYDATYAVTGDDVNSVYVTGRSPSYGDAFVAKIEAKVEGGVAPWAVVNAASYAAGPDVQIAPGMIAALFGSDLATGTLAASTVPLPLTLLDATVTFNGIQAPLYFVSRDQVNVQIPFELAGGTVTVQVNRGDSHSPLYHIGVGPVWPGVFSMNMQGTGDAVTAHSSDFRLVTRSDPAVAGEYLTFYATGLGQPTTPVPTGGAPSQPFPEALIKPQVTIAGTPAFVSWAGPAPTLVGVFQVNILMPAGVPAGEQVLQLTTNGIPANPVTVSVR